LPDPLLAGKPVRKQKIDPRWIVVRKTVQYVALAVFLFLFLISRQDSAGKDYIAYFLRFDPLLALTSLLASRTLLAVTVIELIAAVLLALVVGRAWCGWLCPLGTTLDIFSFKKTAAKKMPEELRAAKYGLLLVMLVSAVLGNLTLLIFDPLTILYRTLTSAIHPALNQILTVVETSLYPVPFLQGLVTWLEDTLRPGIFPLDPLYFQQALLFGLFFLAIIGLNKQAPRFWCRYLCPTGALLGLISKVSIFRRETSESCRNCAICSRACPTGTIDPGNGFRSDPGECTLCLVCFMNCPDSTLTAHSPLSTAPWNSYNPGRRQVLTSAAISVAGLALFRSQGLQEHPDVRLLRPPGALDDRILSTCLRCGACMRVCPTNVIQPAGMDTGLERLWTPVMVPERGFCEFTCNLCGQVCPVEAIPPLPLDQKQTTVIGKAYIDQNHCIAWSDHKMCMVCEEMCPLPEKAITLVETEIRDAVNSTRVIRVPQVDRTKCIGCGVCEFRCPVIGEAAIRVQAVNQNIFVN
jgi:MauM/NapG family ferredoxin protein